MTRSSNKELVEPYDEPEQVLHSLRNLFKTTSFDHSNSLKFELFSDHERQFEEDITKTTTEPTMEEYMMRTREDYGLGSKNKDTNKHIKRVLEIVDVFTTPNVTPDQLMFCVFPITLIGAASRWEFKKVNKRVYDAQVGCKLYNGPHYTKDCPLKEEEKTLEEAYYTQFGVSFPQAGRYRATAQGFY
ncbi:hypothetical protein Tco_0634552 [Tanacetum coccineum]